jgi:hypothetical protein
MTTVPLVWIKVKFLRDDDWEKQEKEAFLSQHAAFFGLSDDQ